MRSVAALWAAALAVVLVSAAAAAGPTTSRNGLIAFVDYPGAEPGEIFAVSADGGRPRNLSRNPRHPDSEPVISPDGRRIAFTSGRDGFVSLYVARLDGSGVKLLARLLPGESDPTARVDWSPDGRQLVFELDGGIAVVRAAGGPVRTISGEGVWPSWSADGRRVAYEIHRQPNERVVVATPAGRVLWERPGSFAAWSPDGRKLYFRLGKRMVVTDVRGRTLASFRGTPAWPDEAWSPDGSRIVFDRGTARYVADWRGRRPHRLGRRGSVAWSPGGARLAVGQTSGVVEVFDTRSGRTRQIASAALTRVFGWSPDDSWILFGSSGPSYDGWTHELRAVRPDGRGNHAVVRAGANFVISGAAFARRGHTVLYQGAGGRGSELFTVQPDGKGARQLTRDGRAKRSPAWSPDGTALAYSANVDGDGNFGLLVRDVGSGVTRTLGVPVGDPGPEHPSWAPDGTRIAFFQNGTSTYGGYVILVARLDGSPPVEFVRNGLDPSWSPDGTQIAYVEVDTWSLKLVDDAGSTTRTVVPTVGSFGSPTWSPDGSWIAYTTTAAIRAVHPDGTGDHLIVTGSADWLAWSPDGEWIAYSRGSLADAEVFLVRPDGTDRRRLTYGFHPSWQPLPALKRR